ncbi:MAG: CHAD domain-containing protein [Deltaproteobacteria bacterium]|nr:CHAD domain-containing protein [Deltaproteobacteria bacterium]
MIDDLGPQHARIIAKGGSASRRRHAAAPTVPLARRALELIEIVAVLDAASAPRAIHDLRTTIRRVETLLAAEPEPAPGDATVARQLRRIRKRAGKVRDVDVHLKALRALPRALAAAGGEDLAADLRTVRRKRQKRLLRAIDEACDHGLVKRLRRAASGASGSVHADPLAVSRALAGVLADFAGAYEGAAPLRAANLHRFRIASKRLRYRAESFAPHPLAGAIATELERAQDAVGVWHDWVTLAARAEKALGTGRGALVAALRARAESSLVKAIAVTGRVAARLATMTAVGSRKGVRKITASGAAAPEAVRLAARTPA